FPCLLCPFHLRCLFGPFRGRGTCRHLAAQHGYRSLCQREGGVRSCRDTRPQGWTIGIGLATVAIRMPVVLFTSETVHADWSREKPLTARTVIMEDNPYCMRILLILVNNHHRPLFVGAEHGICRDQNVTCGISHLASGSNDPT